MWRSVAVDLVNQPEVKTLYLALPLSFSLAKMPSRKTYNGELASRSSRELLHSAHRLLEELSHLDLTPENQTRRQKAVEILLRHSEAGFCFWSWGHGVVGQDMIPVAIFPVGLNPAQLSSFFQLSMIPDSDLWVRKPMLPALCQSRQSCGIRSDFWTDQQWQASSYRQRLVDEVGLDEWLVCVRYESEKVWSCISLFKPVGQGPVSEATRWAVETAMVCFRWLRCDTSESDGRPHVFPDLSIRNKEVLYLLLDGRSRKEIAASMGITLHIVNDCIKQIYSHFGTTSATELAAMFLKAR